MRPNYFPRNAVLALTIYVACFKNNVINAFFTNKNGHSPSMHLKLGHSDHNNCGEKLDNGSRRNFILKSTFFSSALVFSQTTGLKNANASERERARAVGSAEKLCQKEGNCLEKGDLDGAIGWNWGAKERCDATDPRCGTNGILQEMPPSGNPVPILENDMGITLNITAIVELEIGIARQEKGYIRIGFYGETSPRSVEQMMAFCQRGLVTSSKLLLEDGYGVTTSPIVLNEGGILNRIYPGNALEFGIPNQGIAYAKERGMNKIGEDFVPQPRPSNFQEISEENSARSHLVAGLISIPKKGLGYGGNGFESEDEAFASSFQITASAVPSMDKDDRKVIGQLMDDQSMAFLARLASLPTRKGFKGVVPGQNSGPPLLKTTLQVNTVSQNN